MKSIDFTRLGGYPLCQDDLGYLQAAFTEAIMALNGPIINGNTPVVISGMVASVVGSTVTITAGWFYYMGKFIRFGGGSLTPAGGAVVLIDTSTSSSTLPFYDGSTPPVIDEDTSGLLSGADTAPGGPFFTYTYLMPYGVALGKNSRPGWSSIAVATASGDGGVSGTLYYKIDAIANTLLLKGSLTAADPYNFAALPAFSPKTIVTLQAFPTTGVYFKVVINAFDSSVNLLKDSTSTQYILDANAYVDTAGNVNIFFLKPATGCASYDIQVNAVLSLD